MDFLPDLATKTPLWLALLTVGINAVVGALRASVDDHHHWDIVGMATFAVIGAAYALRAGLPVVSAIFIGTVSAVGGGVLVSVMKDEVPQIFLASAPNALVATLSAGVYVAVDVSSARAAAVSGVVAAIVAHVAAERLGLTSRRAVGVSALLLTRSKKR